MDIRGFVDYFETPNVIGGWASDGLRTPVKLQAFHNSVLVASGETSFYRNDTKGSHGFRLYLTDVVVERALAFREITVFAVTAEGNLVEIPLHPHVISKACFLVARMLIFELNPEELTKLAFAMPSMDGAGSKGSCANLRISSSQQDTGIPSGLSFIGVTPGHISADNSVIVGENGYLFIWQGSNDLAAQYAEDRQGSALRRIVEGWIKKVEDRHMELRRRNIRFVQMIIPEKSSIVGEFFPRPIPPETPLLSVLDQELRAGTLGGIYLRSLNHMRADPERTSMFRHMDSHLSPFGAWSIFRKLLAIVGAPTERSVIFDVCQVQVPDLGSKFPDLPLCEYVFHPRSNDFQDFEVCLKRVEYESPPDGGHVGIRSVWTNPSAPVALRVVAFANSFFERAASPANLSWWAARWFREFHFVWSPFVSYDYIDRIAPDVVVCQTIERFLPMVPRT